MIDTNALVALSFALIQQFTNVVHLPGDCVPTKREDLSEIQISTPYGVPHVVLKQPNGATFAIYEGGVRQFRAPSSFSFRSESQPISSFVGEPMVGLAEAEIEARRLIHELSKSRASTNEMSFRVDPEGSYQGKPLPIYFGRWVGTNDADLQADVEFDARSGQLTRIDLLDGRFVDLTKADDMCHKAYRLFPNVRTISTNEVIPAIEGIHRLSRRIGLPPGLEVSLDNVRWESTHRLQANAAMGDECSVAFTNGVVAMTLEGAVIWVAYDDAALMAAARRHDWRGWKGVITNDWRQLADAVAERLCRDAQFPRETMKRLRPRLTGYPRPELGEVGPFQTEVTWSESLDTHGQTTSVPEFRDWFNVNLELRTGDIFSIQLLDPELIATMRKVQSTWK